MNSTIIENRIRSLEEDNIRQLSMKKAERTPGLIKRNRKTIRRLKRWDAEIPLRALITVSRKIAESTRLLAEQLGSVDRARQDRARPDFSAFPPGGHLLDTAIGQEALRQEQEKEQRKKITGANEQASGLIRTKDTDERMTDKRVADAMDCLHVLCRASDAIDEIMDSEYVFRGLGCSIDFDGIKRVFNVDVQEDYVNRHWPLVLKLALEGYRHIENDAMHKTTTPP